MGKAPFFHAKKKSNNLETSKEVEINRYRKKNGAGERFL
jgi:hypothetical protein